MKNENQIQSTNNLTYALNRRFDLNCDLAQQWGVYKHNDEESLLPYVSSVNIACGGHAGDPPSMLQALKLAKERDLAVGAHVGYPDLPGFGRKEIRMDEDELTAYISSQISVLAGMAKGLGISISHFRPHGALYHKCATDTIFAEQLARAVASFSNWLIFVGPAGSYLNVIGDASGLKTVGEVHLDRPYRKDGTLHKFASNRYISFDFALAQANSLIFQNKLITEGNRKIRVSFKTIHLNMDRNYSLQLAEAVKNMLKEPASFESIARIENLQPSDLYPLQSNHDYLNSYL